MKSFSSSAINKSGKKFAPKAPARRAAPAAAPPRRPSVASQTSTAHTPQPAAASATPEPTRRPSTSEPAAQSVSSAIQEPSSTQNRNATVTQNATAIPFPVPQPKRKASFSATATSIIPTPPQPSPPPRASPAEPAPETTIDLPNNQRHERGSIDGSHIDDESHIPPELHPSIESTTETRPTKRPRTASVTTPANVEIPPLQDASNLITPPATQPTDGPTTEESDRAQSQIPPDQPRKMSRSKSRRTSKDENGSGKERKRRVRRKREPTPEGAEQVEIAPALVKMSELCKDLKTGKKSTREMELRKMEQEELERRQKAQEEGKKEEPPVPKQSEERASIDNLDQQPQSGPQMRIVNGEIVLDTTSLQVDRHADAARNAGELEDVVENSLTRRINQASYGKRSKTESWDEEMTDLFYRGLRMFGTDFMMISKLFPGRSRRQIKLKFNGEERRDPERIRETLMGPRETIDINTYSEMTNTVYDDPRVIQQELEEEKKRIEDQHAKEKQAQEELLRNPDGAENGDPSAADKSNGVPTKSKRSRKQLKNMGDGTEEILGTIDDF
ncbi:transcription factor IIIB, Bdp1 subunit [Aspergillus terreus]|uniref:Transcription factor IIIB, Bdp1 subunit n=1 Tax=Aspergillus terreus TaxID=33178 RepID=A0A5M3Z2H0_ASPTE|nr:hypothetical protein ATETN484_0008016000 [Aspergillus terreus]GFF16319.1 transcription factor IIIB, Bdp1 subunit [Aspergillus terreus]